jgi:hypothetical protein
MTDCSVCCLRHGSFRRRPFASLVGRWRPRGERSVQRVTRERERGYCTVTVSLTGIQTRRMGVTHLSSSFFRKEICWAGVCLQLTVVKKSFEPCRGWRDPSHEKPTFGLIDPNRSIDSVDSRSIPTIPSTRHRRLLTKHAKTPTPQRPTDLCFWPSPVVSSRHSAKEGKGRCKTPLFCSFRRSLTQEGIVHLSSSVDAQSVPHQRQATTQARGRLSSPSWQSWTRPPSFVSLDLFGD